jgi:hypothetical protein
VFYNENKGKIKILGNSANLTVWLVPQYLKHYFTAFSSVQIHNLTHWIWWAAPRNLSMALQSFVRPWPLFQFLNPIHSR